MVAGGTHDGEGSGRRGAFEAVGRGLLGSSGTAGGCGDATGRIKGGNVPGRFIPLLCLFSSVSIVIDLGKGAAANVDADADTGTTQHSIDAFHDAPTGQRRRQERIAVVVHVLPVQGGNRHLMQCVIVQAAGCSELVVIFPRVQEGDCANKPTKRKEHIQNDQISSAESS